MNYNSICTAHGRSVLPAFLRRTAEAASRGGDSAAAIAVLSAAIADKFGVCRDDAVAAITYAAAAQQPSPPPPFLRDLLASTSARAEHADTEHGDSADRAEPPKMATAAAYMEREGFFECIAFLGLVQYFLKTMGIDYDRCLAKYPEMAAAEKSFKVQQACVGTIVSGFIQKICDVACAALSSSTNSSSSSAGCGALASPLARHCSELSNPGFLATTEDNSAAAAAPWSLYGTVMASSADSMGGIRSALKEVQQCHRVAVHTLRAAGPLSAGVRVVVGRSRQGVALDKVVVLQVERTGPAGHSTGTHCWVMPRALACMALLLRHATRYDVHSQTVFADFVPPLAAATDGGYLSAARAHVERHRAELDALYERTCLHYKDLEVVCADLALLAARSALLKREASEVLSQSAPDEQQDGVPCTKICKKN